MGYASAPGLADSGPAYAFVSVTPSDTVDLVNGTCRGIHVNVAGNVALIDRAGNSVVLTLAAGMGHPYPATRILSTGTTATGVFAIY